MNASTGRETGWRTRLNVLKFSQPPRELLNSPSTDSQSGRLGSSVTRCLITSKRRDGRLRRRRKHTIDLVLLRASPCLFQLGEHSGLQFVLRPQQELDRAEPLHHVLQYVVH